MSIGALPLGHEVSRHNRFGLIRLRAEFEAQG